METNTRSWTLGELADLLGGILEGPADLTIRRPVPAGSIDPEGITFAESAEYFSRVTGSGVGAVLLPLGTPSIGVPNIQVDKPREAFGRILTLVQRPLPMGAGIHPTAIVSPQAEIADGAFIGAYAVIERHVKIGKGSQVFPFAYIGEDCVLGEDVIVYPHAVLYQDVAVGDRTIIHAGAVLGADGFGFVWDSSKRSKRVKIPHIGGVVIGSDAEIGALTAIDRATSGNTTVFEGAKIDNLVQVGHNSVIREHAVIAGQTAIGGSSIIGRRNEIAGQTAITDHVVLGDDIVIAGCSGVSNDMPSPGVYWGIPARPFMVAKRISGLTARLPEMHKKIKELEARLAALEKEKG